MTDDQKKKYIAEPEKKSAAHPSEAEIWKEQCKLLERHIANIRDEHARFIAALMDRTANKSLPFVHLSKDHIFPESFELTRVLVSPEHFTPGSGSRYDQFDFYVQRLLFAPGHYRMTFTLEKVR